MAINSVAAAKAACIPVIECQRLLRKPHWSCDLFVIPKCPICGGRHTHGAGEGLVSAHCPPPFERYSFYLVEGVAGK